MNANTYIESICETKNSFQFIWNNPNQPLIHAIQRIIMSDINTLAIDMVMIDQNSSILSDQELALALGLIPMESTLAESFLLPDECDCENFCAKCSVKMSLTIACYEDRLNVTSKDLYFQDTRTRPIHESGIPDDIDLLGEDGFGPGIFIAPLTKNQKIRLSCVVRKGTGRIHSKWNPVSKAVFIPAPVVRVNLKNYHNLNDEMEIKLKIELDMQIREKYRSQIKEQLQPLLKERFDAEFDAKIALGHQSLRIDTIDTIDTITLTDQNQQHMHYDLEKRKEEEFEILLNDEVERGLDMIVDEKIDDLVEQYRIDWKKQWVDSCPKGVFMDIEDLANANPQKGWTKPQNNDSCIVCNACVMEAEEALNVQNLIKVTHDDTKFVCNIVSLGGLKPRDILNRAFGILDSKFENLSNEMNKLVFN